jgi:uncharacterized repeat protein (TIGR03803 family)
MQFRWRIGPGAAALGACLVALVLWTSSNAATASTLSTLHTFCNNGTCSDGRQPSGSLVRDGAGNLFGTTELGGADGCSANCGVIYEIKAGNKAFKVIYDFCKTGICDNGANPESGLVIDVHGNLYGIVNNYGKHLRGEIFRVSSSGKKFSVLHSFCSQKNCADGSGTFNPSTALTYQGAASGAPYDGVSALYGVTLEGGANNSGVIFKLQPGGRKWKYTVLYSFCSQSNCADGEVATGLFADASGNLYGTTAAGGGNNNDFNHNGGGVVFKLTGSTYQKLYSFCAEANCTDGEYPEDSTVMDAQGNLIGTTSYGGSANGGTIFRIDTAGAHTKLYDFCSQPSCADGSLPIANPFIDTNGDLLGVTNRGGSADSGVIYRFDGTLHVLYNFCTVGFGCSDGAGPHAPLITDGAGNFYGETIAGGVGSGTVFEFTP